MQGVASPYVRVTDHALSVALFAQPADRNAGLLAAHDEIGVMLRHFAPPDLGVPFHLGRRKTPKGAQ